MNIKMDELKKTKKKLEGIPFKQKGDKSTLFFPIDPEKIVDDGTFMLEVKDSRKEMIRDNIKVGLALHDKVDEKGKHSTDVVLAYADTSYSPTFNLSTYLDIVDARISKKDTEALTMIDCLLVKNEYILAEFDI